MRKWEYYAKLNDDDFKAFSELLDFARTNALWFNIHYSEVEDNWEIEMQGAGEKESFFSGKRIKYFEDAVKYIIENAKEHYSAIKDGDFHL